MLARSAGAPRRVTGSIIADVSREWGVRLDSARRPRRQYLRGDAPGPLPARCSQGRRSRATGRLPPRRREHVRARLAGDVNTAAGALHVALRGDRSDGHASLVRSRQGRGACYRVTRRPGRSDSQKKMVAAILRTHGARGLGRLPRFCSSGSWH